MRPIITLATALALALTGPTASIGATISNDLGGQVIAYHSKVRQLDGRGEHVRIAGRCASACTLYLSAKSYCVEHDAMLQFHAVRYEGNPQAARLFTRWMFSKYPPKVQRWITRNGGLTSSLITLKGEALRQTVRICSP